MPPHCDSKDGPVVKAAESALGQGRVDVVLPYVPAEAESEVLAAFDRVMEARASGGAALEVADEWFYETVVRLHRAGEHAPFTGLKPAGLGHGPVVPVAERAIETGEAGDLVDLLTDALREQVESKLARVMSLRPAAGGPVPQAREYVEAMLGFEVWSHRTYQCITSDPLHDHGAAAHHD